MTSNIVDLKLFEDNEITLQIQMSGTDPEIRETNFRFLLSDPNDSKVSWMFIPKRISPGSYLVKIPKGPYAFEKDKVFCGNLEALVGSKYFGLMTFSIRFVSPYKLQVSAPIVTRKTM